ncbi:hypothetical protein SAMN05444358_1323, partial [Ruegeria halocynthiae]
MTDGFVANFGRHVAPSRGLIQLVVGLLQCLGMSG